MFFTAWIVSSPESKIFGAFILLVFVLQISIFLIIGDGGTAKFKESKNIEETNTGMIFYPNLAVDILKIDFALAQKEVIQVSIYDLNASLLKTINAKGNLGQNSVDVNVSDLKAGQYLHSINLILGSYFSNE